MDWSRMVYLQPKYGLVETSVPLAPHSLRQFKRHANAMLNVLSKKGIGMENTQMYEVTFFLCASCN